MLMGIDRLFEGDRIRHKVFGGGTVVSWGETGIATVDFQDVGVKRLMERASNMELLEKSPARILEEEKIAKRQRAEYAERERSEAEAERLSEQRDEDRRLAQEQRASDLERTLLMAEEAPQDPMAQYAYADVLWQQGEYCRALSGYRKAIELADPAQHHLPGAFIRTAIGWEAKDNRAAATIFHEKELALDPEHADIALFQDYMAYHESLDRLGRKKGETVSKSASDTEPDAQAQQNLVRARGRKFISGRSSEFIRKKYAHVTKFEALHTCSDLAPYTDEQAE